MHTLIIDGYMVKNGMNRLYYRIIHILADGVSRKPNLFSSFCTDLGLFCVQNAGWYANRSGAGRDVFNNYRVGTNFSASTQGNWA